MGKKRYQMSADERDVHERAVRLRKMTDAQLVEHMEHVRSDAYAAGYAEGERKPAEAAGCGKGVLEFIEELSSGITLLPGTIIATGTPAGVGMGFDPPKFLKSGDVVECTIEGIGTLCNTVR